MVHEIITWCCGAVLGMSLISCTPQKSGSETPESSLLSHRAEPAKTPSDVATLRHAYDLRNLAIWQTQQPPAGFVDFHKSAKRFDVGAFVTARHYHFRLHSGGIDGVVAGCQSSAVSAAGTLCPSVVLPGTSLPPTFIHELARQFNRPPPAVGRVCCEGTPSHSIVLYDKRQRPVGEMLLDLKLGWWQVWPGYGEIMQWSELSDELRRMLQKHGVALTDRDGVRVEERQAYRHFQAEEYESLSPFGFQSPRRKTPSWKPVYPSKRLDSVTALEKRRLCVWNMRHMVRALRPIEDGHHLVTQDGTKLMVNTLRWDRCVATFPTQCAATVGEMLPCMERAQRGDPWFRQDASAACRPLYDCVWGIERSITPPSASEPKPAAPTPASPPTSNPEQ